MRDVNMEGITPNEYIAKALVQLRNFKQGALLERSLLTSKHVISEDIKNSYSDINIDELVRSQLMQKVAKHMLNEFGDQITAEPHPIIGGETLYTFQVMVLPTDDLKHIVEYCIRQIPEEILSKIKKGE
jgi:hypothetical protein